MVLLETEVLSVEYYCQEGLTLVSINTMPKRVRVRVWGLFFDIDVEDLCPLAGIYSDLHLITPFGDEYRVDPTTGEWLL